MIRGVYTSGIVESVRIAASASEAVFHAGTLRQSKIAAFTDHTAPKLSRVHANGVGARISDLCVSLGFRFHVGADTAVPQQIHRGGQDRLDQCVAIQFGVLNLQLGCGQHRTAGYASRPVRTLRPPR